MPNTAGSHDFPGVFVTRESWLPGIFGNSKYLCKPILVDSSMNTLGSLDSPLVNISGSRLQIPIAPWMSTKLKSLLGVSNGTRKSFFMEKTETKNLAILSLQVHIHTLCENSLIFWMQQTESYTYQWLSSRRQDKWNKFFSNFRSLTSYSSSEKPRVYAAEYAWTVLW